MIRVRETFKVFAALAAGGVTALAVNRREQLKSATASALRFFPWQLELIKRGLPADYANLQITSPSDLELLYRYGDHSASACGVERAIRQGNFVEWILTSTEAAKMCLSIASTDSRVWRQAIDQIKRLDKGIIRAINQSSSDTTIAFQSAIRVAPMDDIRTLQEYGFLPDTFLKYPKLEPILWAGWILLAVAVI